MSKNRIEAFTDAVIAIVMTLLVLELHQPEGDTFAFFFRSGTAIYYLFDQLCDVSDLLEQSPSSISSSV